MAEFPTYEQMAKNVAEKALDEFLYDGKSIREWIKIIVEQEPTDDKCHYCEHTYTPYKGNTGEFEQEPMRDATPEEQKSVNDYVKSISTPTGVMFDDLISKQAVLDTLTELNAISFYEAQEDSKECYYEIRNTIKKLPLVKPQEQTGHWIENAPEYQNIDPPYICSECGNMHLRKTDYCDQCGCRMVEPQGREN